MSANVGIRVVAIQDADEDVVNIFGFGQMEYVMPPIDGWPFGPNPRIQLDGGGVVWGYQCWWEECWDEQAWRDGFVAGRTVNRVRPPDSETEGGAQG